MNVNIIASSGNDPRLPKVIQSKTVLSKTDRYILWSKKVLEGVNFRVLDNKSTFGPDSESSPKVHARII